MERDLQKILTRVRLSQSDTLMRQLPELKKGLHFLLAMKQEGQEGHLKEVVNCRLGENPLSGFL